MKELLELKEALVSIEQDVSCMTRIVQNMIKEEVRQDIYQRWRWQDKLCKKAIVYKVEVE